MTAPSTQRKPRKERGPKTEAGLRLAFFPQDALTDWRLGRPELRVLMALSCFTNGETGQCIPAQETLADIAGMSRPKVNRIIQDLEALGYIVKMHRSRTWTYQVMNPEIPARGTVPRGGTKQKSDRLEKILPTGVHDPVPPRGTQGVPPRGTQTPLTSLNTGAPPDGEAIMTPDERSPDGSLTGEADQGADASASTPETTDDTASAPLPPSAVSAKQPSRSFTVKKSPFPKGQAPYSPITEASKHLNRQDLPLFMKRADKVGTEKALAEFGLDYRGKPFAHVDLEEAAYARARQAKPKERT